MTIGNFEGERHGVGYQHGANNYWCLDCRSFTVTPAGKDDPRECSTPGSGSVC